MEKDINLANAAVVAENPDTAFVVEGKRLHAVDERVADLKKENANPDQIISLMQEALQALVEFAQDKVESHFLDIDQPIQDQPQLIAKIEQIYTHLPHLDRQKLSSLIHHSQIAQTLKGARKSK